MEYTIYTCSVKYLKISKQVSKMSQQTLLHFPSLQARKMSRHVAAHAIGSLAVLIGNL